MIFTTEKDLISYGKKIGQDLLKKFQSAATNQPANTDQLATTDQAPATSSNPTSYVIELVGDVGAGKTTFTRGIAEGLGIKEPITSPSFTISKRYAFPLFAKPAAPAQIQSSDNTAYLTHYDFYRLPDPGLMLEDLSESIADPNTIVVLEWADTVKNVLPADHKTYQLTVLDDGSREVEEL